MVTIFTLQSVRDSKSQSAVGRQEGVPDGLDRHLDKGTKDQGSSWSRGQDMGPPALHAGSDCRAEEEAAEARDCI